MSSFEKPRIKKVPVENPEYRLNQKLGVDYSSESFTRLQSGCFGADILGRIQILEHRSSIRGYPGSLSKKGAEKEKQMLLKKTMGELVERAHHRNVWNHVQQFIKEALSDESVGPKLQEITNADPRRIIRVIFEDEPVPEELFVFYAIRENRVPTELWKEMLEIQTKNFKEALDQFDSEQLPRLKKSFQERAEKGIQDGALPISTERVESVLKDNVVSLQDGIVKSFVDADGSYLRATNAIFMASYLIREKLDVLEHVFTHEMMHALSGRTIIEYDYSTEGDEGTWLSKDHEDARVGLHFSRMPTPDKSQFRWLNEAVTEMLTTQLHDMESGVYARERKLLTYLMTGGRETISMELFVRAYFEDYDPAHKPSIPHWKSLRAALNESFGPTFLVDLDRNIRANGITQVLEELGIVEKEAEA